MCISTNHCKDLHVMSPFSNIINRYINNISITCTLSHLYSARLLPGAAHPVARQPTNTVSPKPNILAGLAGCTWTWRSEKSTHIQTCADTLRVVSETRTVLLRVCKCTCYIKSDGVRGGPSSQGLVCLKPKVVLTHITQPDTSNLD